MSERSVIARNADWDPWNPPNGYFNFCVLLNMLLRFCEDYRRIVINARHELILIRSRNDNNCLIGDPIREPEITKYSVQSTVADALCAVERNKTIDAACSGKQAIFQHGFSLVGSVRLSAPEIASHDQTFVSHQNRYSVGETAIRNLRFANWPEKHRVRRWAHFKMIH